MIILIKLNNKFNYNYKKEIMINKQLINGLIIFEYFIDIIYLYLNILLILFIYKN